MGPSATGAGGSGRISALLLSPQIVPIAPSSTMSSPRVTITEVATGARRSGRSRIAWSKAPRRNAAPTAIRAAGPNARPASFRKLHTR